MLWMLVAVLLARPKVEPQYYNAWTDNGYHLMMSDNGTPEDPEDDIIIDWEDNRKFEIEVED